MLLLLEKFPDLNSDKHQYLPGENSPCEIARLYKSSFFFKDTDISVEIAGTVQ